MANFDESINKREKIETQENRGNLRAQNVSENLTNQIYIGSFFP